MKTAFWFVKSGIVMLGWPLLAAFDAMRLHKHVENAKFVSSQNIDNKLESIHVYDRTQDLTYRAMKWLHK